MGKVYKDIFFDLDRTLWDFDKNTGEALTELYDQYNLKEVLGVDYSEFLQTFRETNASEWKDFRMGEKTKDEMRANRFVQTFFKHGSGDWKKARQMSVDYLKIGPYKSNLIEGAKEILEELSESHRLHILTNGFSESQDKKINSSGIRKYFKEIIISDETPYRKPDREIFIEAIKRAEANLKEALMVGDDWRNDIQGAKRAGMDQIFFNPTKKGVLAEGSCTYEVAFLSEIPGIVRPLE